MMLLSAQQGDKLETAKEQRDRAIKDITEELERKRDKDIKRAENDLEREIRKEQNKLKRMAAFLPPLLPMMLGLGVWLSRRSRELTGVSEGRLRGQL